MKGSWKCHAAFSDLTFFIQRKLMVNGLNKLREDFMGTDVRFWLLFGDFIFEAMKPAYDGG